MRIIFLTIIVLCFSMNTVSAQTFDLGSWNILNVKYNLDENLSFFGEAQVRQAEKKISFLQNNQL